MGYEVSMAVIEAPGFIPALALKINDALERAKLHGRLVDFAINRFTEILTSMPALLFQMLLILVFSGGRFTALFRGSPARQHRSAQTRG